jgi:hypothetical protein
MTLTITAAGLAGCNVASRRRMVVTVFKRFSESE